MSLECSEESLSEMELDIKELKSLSPEEKDGVYIVRSIDFFFLVTVRLVGVSFDEYDPDVKTSEYEINCVPTPSESASSNEDIPTRPCVEISVVIGTGDRPTSLDIFRYDKDCSLVGQLQRKTGTQQMLMSTLAFAAKEFGQKVFHFTDASMIECENVESISLRDYGLLVYGRTWYERNFDATPREPGDLAKRDEYALMLNTIISENQSNSLIEGFRSQTYLTVDELTRYVYILRESAANGNTWQQMIQRVTNHETRGCSFFSHDTVENILKLLGLEPILNYKIDLSDGRASQYFKDKHKIF